jgi:uncharacterized protein (DUF849 family)
VPLTAEQLAQAARECMKEAAQLPEPARLEEDARAALQSLVDDQHIRAKHPDAVGFLTRALAVDMTEPANRKGDLPKELGLVSRESKAAAIKHHAIVLMMGRLLDYTEFSNEGKAVFCYRSKRQAIDAVVEAFFDAELDTDLTASNVEQLWRRREQASLTTRW